MFRKVLIANRGTAAVRIAKTLRRMGIPSVAVYTKADQDSLHVDLADEAVLIGDGPAGDSYLNADRILQAARDTGADAIHPGYGFLSENAAFARRCREAGIAFIGPEPEQIEWFGLKHMARDIAAKAGVPLLPGTGLLAGPEEAVREAERIGYPVMLKSTAGGGGIGMRVCRDAQSLRAAVEAVAGLAERNFNDGGVYLEKYVERARHVEVQIFGNRFGEAVAIGERDCSVQRRNQKILEECPAPNLPAGLRMRLHEAAVRLASEVGYRSAGTVEFLVDPAAQAFYFLEMNTRLQVEHGVTEEVFGIDLVEWMVKEAADELKDLQSLLSGPKGWSIEARVYAEDGHLDFLPSAGQVDRVALSPAARTETWVRDGVKVTTLYDPMLATVIVRGESREEALDKLREALSETRFYGVTTNLRYLEALLEEEDVRAGRVHTRMLEGFAPAEPAIEVIDGGLQTTVQDWPGRTGYWEVGVPPCGPMDALSFRIGNRLLGNEEGAPGLELTLRGGAFRFRDGIWFCVTGADMGATLDGAPVETYRPVFARRGQVLRFGEAKEGMRTYLLVAGGLDVPQYMGSASTFTLGGFGGHGGRALRAGDVVGVRQNAGGAFPPPEDGRLAALPPSCRPAIARTWTIGAIPGPHCTEEFLQADYLKRLEETEWEVHFNSSRTGVRLIGPKPPWAREDGGEAGLHPSNIHDNAYAIGALNLTGDMPVLLGLDGPSLGGFVCPVTVASAEQWKIGQLRPGDKVRFRLVTLEEADELRRRQERFLTSVGAARTVGGIDGETGGTVGGMAGSTNGTAGNMAGSINGMMGSTAGTISGTAGGISGEAGPDDTPDGGRLPGLDDLPPDPDRSWPPDYPILARTDGDPAYALTVRASGDRHLLVECGPMELDLRLRFRIHALMEAVRQCPDLPVLDLVPGIRSLQIHIDPAVMTVREACRRVLELAETLPPPETMKVPSRIVRLPLSWDDPAARLAVERYQNNVRPDAPWCPSNLEFIRRINGLESIGDVKRIVFEASYLVLGLGDVYLGAPVGTPADPRHRLVTTKYNPARTWTPENAVGIGGAYLCIYGMEGPGGYQLVGRTVPVWNTFRTTRSFQPGKPWLLRHFDQIRFYPVPAEELLKLREDFLRGRFEAEIEETVFDLGEYLRFLESIRESADRFRRTQQAAFRAERERWKALGFDRPAGEPDDGPPPREDDLPAGTVPVLSPLPGIVWKLTAEDGQFVTAGDTIVVVESMKMEFAVRAPESGRIAALRVKPGDAVQANQLLAAVEPAGSAVPTGRILAD